MSHVFVSYSGEDGDFADSMVRQLHDNGFEVWIDTERLAAGDDWRQGIDEALKQSFAVIVVMSPEAKSSEYVTYEWAFAIGLGKMVIPILIKPTKLHPRLEALQYSDFTNRKSRPWQVLIARVQKLKQDITEPHMRTEQVIAVKKTAEVTISPYIFSRLGIPAVILEGDGIFEYGDTKEPQSVQYVWDSSEFTLDNLPLEIADLCRDVLRERMEFAEKNDKPLYNGSLARVLDFQPLREDKSGFKGFRLRLQHTDYHTFLATNHASESTLASKVAASSLFASEKISVKDLRNSKLANGLTVSVNLIIEDPDTQTKFLLVQKRNVAKVTHSFSTWQCSAAGSVNMSADTSTSYPNPFFSAVIREVKEETGIALDFSAIRAGS
jgi:hypothetical protein